MSFYECASERVLVTEMIEKAALRYLSAGDDLIYRGGVEAFCQDGFLGDIQDLLACFTSTRHGTPLHKPNYRYSTVGAVFNLARSHT